MKDDRRTFNVASYALSHLRTDPFRTITTVTMISITVAFVLLTSSLMSGIISEAGADDGKAALIEGRIPGSIDMFEEFRLDRELSDDAKSSLMDYLTATTLIVLLVSAFSIYNTMTMSVTQRKREIGVLRAVGHPSGDVLKIFMTEGAMLGLLSWLIALFLGTPLIVNLAAYLIERGDKGFFFVQPTIPLPLVVGSLVLTMGISLVSTYVAVTRYVRASPVEMLRAGT